MRYYLAYGSNLHVEQMKRRCPTAVAVGTFVLEGFRLVFAGSLSGGYLTLKADKGESVPCVVWKIQSDDEKSLDIYEGYPRFYTKMEVKGKVKYFTGNEITRRMFVYLMPYINYSPTSKRYFDICCEGYDTWGFDKKILSEALSYSNKKVSLYKTPNKAKQILCNLTDY